jgi:uncharacterized RDD family membrane protein YckC
MPLGFSSVAADFLALGAGLAGVAFLVGLPLGALALPLAFLSAFGFAGFARETGRRHNCGRGTKAYWKASASTSI